jgi:hypothetical protein
LIFSFMINLQTVGFLERVISSSQGLYLNTGEYKHRINTYTYQTSIPCVGFKPTIHASEQPKTIYALDRSATGGPSVGTVRLRSAGNGVFLSRKIQLHWVSLLQNPIFTPITWPVPWS